MKNMKCKGGEPALMTIKEDTTNPLLNNMDIDKTKSKLQKEIEKVKADQMSKEEKERENQRRLEEAQQRFDNGEVDDESDKEEVEEKPQGIIQPKYKIVHSYNMEMMDAWGGYTTSKMDHETMLKSRVPVELTVVIQVKWIESMKLAKLDINDTTLVFEYPEIYYLDLNLKYKVDKDAGSAKFDKKKKTLTIRCPIIAMTEDSQKVMDEHYKKFVLEQEERLQNLQLQGEAVEEKEEETQAETTQSETTQSDRPQSSSEIAEPVSQELHDAAMAKLQEMAGTEGYGS
jgi:hypothetical protein